MARATKAAAWVGLTLAVVVAAGMLVIGSTLVSGERVALPGGQGFLVLEREPTASPPPSPTATSRPRYGREWATALGQGQISRCPFLSMSRGYKVQWVRVTDTDWMADERIWRVTAIGVYLDPAGQPVSPAQFDQVVRGQQMPSSYPWIAQWFVDSRTGRAIPAAGWAADIEKECAGRAAR